MSEENPNSKSQWIIDSMKKNGFKEAKSLAEREILQNSNDPSYAESLYLQIVEGAC